jgi:hypothetical protein
VRRDVDTVIEALLAGGRGWFRNIDLALALGVSAGRASQLIHERLLSGELSREGRGFGRGRGLAVPQAAAGDGFWPSLAMTCKHLRYVAIPGPQLRTRQQVHDVLALDRGGHFLLADFTLVRHVTPAAADELLREIPRRWGTFIEPINTSPEVFLELQCSTLRT